MSAVIRLVRRARSESGHTLIELVVAMSIGMVILLIAFQLLDRSLGLTTEVSDRVDAVQRGRLAMDRVTRQLRSQVCLGGEAALVTATGDSVTFYSNLGTSGIPDKDTFTFDEPARSLTHTQVRNNGVPPPATLFTGATRVNTLLSNAARNGPSPTLAPVFTYYGFDNANPPKAEKLLTPLPLTQAQRENTARIVVSFVSRPTKATTTNTRAAVLTDEIFVRSADPNDPAPVPKCA